MSRNRRLNFSDRLADGIRQTIAASVYHRGGVLQTLSEMSSDLGVSMQIPKLAIAKPVREDFVSLRQSVDVVVLERGDRVWRGNMLQAANRQRT